MTSLSGKENVTLYIEGGKTATITATASATADVDITYNGAGNRGLASWLGLGSSPINFNDSADVSTLTSASDNVSISASYTHHGSCCGGGGLSLTGYTGGSYTSFDLGSVSALCKMEGYTEGTTESDGSITYDVTFGGDAPIAQIYGPVVGGSLTTNPANGASLSFNNTSYDPDDGLASMSGICTAIWELTEPDGNVITGGDLNSFSHTAAKAGKHELLLIVTDNEGVQSNTSVTFNISGPRICYPTSPVDVGACSDTKTSMKLDPICGNMSLISHDPTPTRGSPLKNEIEVRTRMPVAPSSQYMGNGFFTYGIEVAVIGSTDPQRVLIDGAGYEYDYGLQSTGSSPKSAGVYPTLTQSSSGFVLNNAGAPDEIYVSGNFTYEFDTSGKLTTITDENGNVQTVSYDSFSKPILVTDTPSNKTIEFEYGSNDKIDKIIENGGFAYREILYTTNDLVSAIVTKDSSDVEIRSLILAYDVQDRISTIVRDGDSATIATLSYQNDGHGGTLVNVTYPTGQTNFNYFASVTGSSAAYRTTIPNAKGGVVKYDYDAIGNLIAIRLPTHNGGSSNVVYTYSYDSNRNVLTQSNGATTITNTYNSLGLVTQSIDNVGRYTNYTYSGVNLTGISDNIGTLASFAYTDSSFPNAITEMTDGDSHTWNFSRNAFGQIDQISPPTGSPTGAMTFVYEENTSSPEYGWLKTVTNGAGDTVEIDSYTSLGDPTSITTSPSSGVTRTVQYAYDATQRVTQVTHDDGKTIQVAYTGANATSVTDEAGTLRQYGYCAECGKLTSASGPLSWALSWVLDADKDVTSFEDAMTNSTTYTYGSARELKKITYPDSQTEDFVYDDYGRPKEYSNTAGHYQSYLYDGSGWLTSFGTLTESATFSYLNDGSVYYETLGVGANGSWTKHDYTAGRRLNLEQRNYQPIGANGYHTFYYEFNPDGTMLFREWYRGILVFRWDYQYDAAGRMTQISTTGGHTTDFTYDGEGRVATQVNSNGTSIEYEYNTARNWPTKITYYNGSTKTQEYLLEYDGGSNTVGNLTEVTELDGSVVTYTYDALYRLTSETRTGTNSYTRSYTYDLAGNILTKNGSAFGTYDSANKLTNVLGQTVSHDGIGNITSVGGSVLPLNNFTWTDRSKLMQASGASNRYYLYQADGQMIHSDDRITDNMMHLRSLGQITGEDPGSNPSYAYTYGPTGLVSMSKITGTNMTYWYEYGPQGETRALTNTSGTITDTYSYTAYGENISSSGSTRNPFRYGGRVGYYTDKDSQLILAGQRWYSPQLLRWLSRDPIHYEGGVNLYEYVQGNPVGYVDESGLDSTATWGPLVSPGVREAAAAAGRALAGAAGTTGRFIAPALTPAAAGGALVGGGLVAGGLCLWDLEGCRAAVQLYCEERGIDPLYHIGNKGQKNKERNYAGSSKGTKNPKKHERPHPTDPTKVIVKDPQTGKKVVKPKID